MTAPVLVPALDPVALDADAATARTVATLLAFAGEALYRAAIRRDTMPDGHASVIAWNREADDLLARSLEFHADARALAAAAEWARQ